MTARPDFKLLRDYAGKILDVFETAGYEPVQLPVLQSAEVYLDVMGEDVRSEAFVFEAAHGREVCLRPDLTVPACRRYLEEARAPGAPRRLSYSGPIFRFAGASAGTSGAESHQAGIESLGAPAAAEADAEVVRLVLDGVRAAGLKRVDLKLGDVGIFRALVRACPMPERWRQSILRLHSEPRALDELITRLASPRSYGRPSLPPALRARLVSASEAEADEALAQHLEAAGLPVVGNRTLAEVRQSLLERLRDDTEPPLPHTYARLIRDYLALPPLRPKNLAAQLAELTRGLSIDLSAALGAHEARLTQLAHTDVDVAEARFATDIGRNFEYYTGLVFEVAGGRLGAPVVVARGGRYDGLLKAVGAPGDVPAVGAAISIESLLKAVRG